MEEIMKVIHQGLKLNILISAKEIENHLVSFTPTTSTRKLQNNSGLK